MGVKDDANGSKKRKQCRLEGFLNKKDDVNNQELHFQVPFLPLDAPKEPTPSSFQPQQPLYDHQMRSLHRMLQIESRNEQYTKYNFGHLDYEARGGCLADAIGMGKTATILALICSAPRTQAVGGNLVVAPSHLLAQWHQEVRKFVKEGEINVVVGLYNLSCLGPSEISNRLLVLVSVEEVLGSPTLYYESHELFKHLPVEEEQRLQEQGYWSFMNALKKKKIVNKHWFVPARELDLETSQQFEQAAQFVHKAYRGLVWTSCLHFPQVPWHRVIFEEVQDLVSPGKQSQDCFIQLTRSARHVWLVTATPFPEKAESIYANNQLLGFKRLRLCPKDAAFDEIKRKLYLRNCAQVHEQVISSQIRIQETYFSIALHPKEMWFYRVELAFALADVDVSNDGDHEVACDAPEAQAIEIEDDDVDEDDNEDVLQAQCYDLQSAAGIAASVAMDFWPEKFVSCRQCCVHVGLSDRIVQRQAKRAGIKKITPLTRWEIKSPHELFSDEVEFLRRQCKNRSNLIRDWQAIEGATRNTLGILGALLKNVYWGIEECFADVDASGLATFFDSEDLETKPGFRVLVKHVRKWGPDQQIEPLDCLIYSRDEIEDYLRKHWDSTELLRKFFNTMRANWRDAKRKVRRLKFEKQHLDMCMTWYREHQQEMVAVFSPNANDPAASASTGLNTRSGRLLNSAPSAVDATDESALVDASFTHVTSKKLSHYGSKISRLVTYLKDHSTVQVVVFTQWPMAMQLLGQALRMHGISNGIIQTGGGSNSALASRISPEEKTRQVTYFQQGLTRVLILNARTNASGINLMNASHVVFLEPVGNSPSQASMLEQQAIGRVVRMGQKHSQVHVLRFVAEQTLEMQLYEAIHRQRKKHLLQEQQLFNGEIPSDGTNEEVQELRKQSYVCWEYEQEAAREELPKDMVVTSSRNLVRCGEDGDEEIEFVGEMTLEEAIQTRAKTAEVVDLTAGDDDDDADNDEAATSPRQSAPPHEPPRAQLARMAAAYEGEKAVSAVRDRKMPMPAPAAPVAAKRARDCKDGETELASTSSCPVPCDQLRRQAEAIEAARRLQEETAVQAQQQQQQQQQKEPTAEPETRVPRYPLAQSTAAYDANKELEEELAAHARQQRQKEEERAQAENQAALEAVNRRQEEFAAEALRQKQQEEIQSLRQQLAERAAAYDAAAKQLQEELAAQARRHRLAMTTAYEIEAAASAALDRKIPLSTQESAAKRSRIDKEHRSLALPATSAVAAAGGAASPTPQAFALASMAARRTLEGQLNGNSGGPVEAPRVLLARMIAAAINESGSTNDDSR